MDVVVDRVGLSVSISRGKFGLLGQRVVKIQGNIKRTLKTSTDTFPSKFKDKLIQSYEWKTSKNIMNFPIRNYYPITKLYDALTILSKYSGESTLAQNTVEQDDEMEVETTTKAEDKPTLISNPTNTISPTKGEAVSTNAAQKITKPYVAPLVIAAMHTKYKGKTSEKREEASKNKNADQTQPYASNWLLEQKPDAYTIQIIASFSQKNLLAFAKKNFADKQTAYYQKSRQDKQWFVLVYSIFPTHKEALSAIDTLHTDLKKNRPYPLQIKKIQEVIR